MNEFNISTAQVEAISRKEWLKNRRSAKASITISGGSSATGTPGSSSSEPTAEKLADLSDVTLTEPKQDDILKYNGQGWENKPLSDAIGDEYYTKKDIDDPLYGYVKRSEGGIIHEPIDVRGDNSQVIARSNYNDEYAVAEVVGAKVSEGVMGRLRWTPDQTNIMGAGNLFYNGEQVLTTDGDYLTRQEASKDFLPRAGGKINGSLEIEKPGTQLFLTADEDDDGEYIARIEAGSIGADFGEISWKHGETHIKGESDTLQFNDKELITRDALEEAIENIDIGDLDLSDTPIAEDVLVADTDSVLTTSDFADTPIAEEVIPTDVADTLTYGEMQRSLRVFELEGLICLASSHPIFDDEVIALARKLSQGWSGKQGWSISQQFNSQGGEPSNPTYNPHMFTLIPWMMPNPKQPNGLYYYKVAIDGEWLSPSTLLSYFISSLDEHLKIYWGKRAKRVAFGADTSGKYKRAATLRFGVAVGHQIAPFKLCVQSKCFIYPDGHVLLNDTTWGQCVQFRV